MRIGQVEFTTARSYKHFLFPTIVAPARYVELWFEWTAIHWWTWALLVRLRSRASIDLENRRRASPSAPWP